MPGFGGSGFGSGTPGQSGGFRTGDLRGQGGDNRDSYQVPHEGMSRAKYDSATDKEAAGLTRPSLFERFKRWFSANF